MLNPGLWSSASHGCHLWNGGTLRGRSPKGRADTATAVEPWVWDRQRTKKDVFFSIILHDWGDCFFRFSDFPLGLEVNFEESSNVEAFFFESIFGMQHDATPSMMIHEFQILLICVFWDNPEPVFCVGQGISSIYPLVNIQKTMKNHHCSWVNPL